MANYAEPRVVDSAQGVRDRRVGPVVRDDELELRNRLRQDALDALANRGVRVVRGHHDGGQRRVPAEHRRIVSDAYGPRGTQGWETLHG